MAADVVALIGSGNWGSAIATKMGLNVLDAANGFKPVVKMCVDPGAKRGMIHGGLPDLPTGSNVS